jgi:serine/threonine protein kinase
MDYCNGGELFYHLKQAGRFPEPQARLYAGEICSALHHLHMLKIIYRDLKPENVLLDSEGHVRITDFGLAKDAMELGDKTNTFCGTPYYLAPEVIKGKGHGRGVDWWSLGTMIYEMLGGLPPFYSENFNVMYERILRAPLEFKPAACFSQTARELVDGMLQKEPDLRLGSGPADGDDIRKHAWFATIDWTKLEARQLTPPFKPNVKSELDTSNFDEEFTSQAVESVVPDMPLGGGGKPPPTQNFEGFTFVDKGHLG